MELFYAYEVNGRFCRLTQDSPKGAEAEILSEEANWGGHPYRLTVGCCPTKNNERFEWFVEKATELARALGASLRTDVLRRARRTPSQTSLSAEERLHNVSGVFSLKHIPSSARHILLVDDTFTTGATLASCLMLLRSVLDPSVRISIATLAVVEA